VTLHLRDGRQLTSPPTEAAGDPEAPATTAEVRAKFHAGADPILGPARAAGIEAAVDALGESDVTPLLHEIHAPAEPTGP
jgi:hypothetical protein